MKIAFVIPSIGISGGVSIALYYSNKLANMGHQVSVISISGDEYNGWYGNIDANIIHLANEEGLNEVLKQSTYDCVIATFWTTVFLIRKSGLYCKKTFYLIQGVEENFYENGDIRQKLVSESINGNEHKIVISDFLKKELSSRYKNKKFHLIKNGIDFSKLSSSNCFMNRGRKLRILVEGPICAPSKFVEQTLRELSYIDNLDIWVLSGSKKEPNLLNFDLFFKAIPFEQTCEVYKSCDILVKYSKTEGFSLPVIEAMANGVIPILNDFGGNRDYLVHKKNGFLIKELTADEIYSGIEYILKNFNKMKQNAIETAKLFRWTDQSKQFESLLINSPDNNNHLLPEAFNVKANGEIINSKGTIAVTTYIRKNILDKFIDPKLSTIQLVGWVANEDGTPLEKVNLILDGKLHGPITVNKERKDVATSFNITDTSLYGFDVTIPYAKEIEVALYNQRPSKNGKNKIVFCIDHRELKTIISNDFLPYMKASELFLYSESDSLIKTSVSSHFSNYIHINLSDEEVKEIELNNPNLLILRGCLSDNKC